MVNDNRSPSPDTKGADLEVRVLCSSGSLKDVEVKLCNEQEQLVRSGKTDDQGKVQFRNLPSGPCILKAEPPSDGYHLTENLSVVLADGADISRVLFFSKDKTDAVRSGALQITAVTGCDGSPLGSFEFDVYDQHDNLIETIKTNSEGIATTGKHAPGIYSVSPKLTSSSPVFTNQENWSATITEGKTATVFAQFFKCASLTVTITTYAGEPLPGAKFQLVPEGEYDGNKKQKKEKEKEKEQTDDEEPAETVITFSNVRPGNYKLVEVRTPRGYSSHREPLDISLSEGKAEDISISYYTQELDRRFKAILHNAHILAAILKGFVPEYKNMSTEKIIESFARRSPNKNPRVFKVRGISNEEGSGNNGMLIFDTLYSLLVPAGGNTRKDILIFVDVEGQANSTKVKYTYTQRQIAHIGHMIVGQRGTADGYFKQDYENIKKCYCIFICIDQPENIQNTVVYHDLKRSELDIETGKVFSTEIAPEDDLIKLITINLGRYKDLEEKNPCFDDVSVNALGILDLIVFPTEVPKKERQNKLLQRGFVAPEKDMKEVYSVWSDDSEFAKRIRREAQEEAKKKEAALKKEAQKKIDQLEDERNQERQEKDVFKMRLAGHSPADIAKKMGIPLTRVAAILGIPMP